MSRILLTTLLVLFLSPVFSQGEYMPSYNPPSIQYQPIEFHSVTIPTDNNSLTFLYVPRLNRFSVGFAVGSYTESDYWLSRLRLQLMAFERQVYGHRYGTTYYLPRW